VSQQQLGSQHESQQLDAQHGLHFWQRNRPLRPQNRSQPRWRRPQQLEPQPQLGSQQPLPQPESQQPASQPQVGSQQPLPQPESQQPESQQQLGSQHEL
jgi:hypothetical protein